MDILYAIYYRYLWAIEWIFNTSQFIDSVISPKEWGLIGTTKTYLPVFTNVCYSTIHRSIWNQKTLVITRSQV